MEFINGKPLTSDSVTIKPVEYCGAIRNPVKGFIEWDTNMLNEWATTGKTYIGWNELENNVSDGVEKIIHWSNIHWAGIEDKNFKVIPRVWLDYPGEDPAWPEDMVVGDYTSEQFKTRVKAFVKKLSEAWDNDPRIAYIQMGIIGKWGEHHSPEPTEEIQNILANAFLEAFKNKKVLIRYPWHFTGYNFGIYWDSFAHTNEVVEHEAAMLALGDYWKTAIVGGETAYNWGDHDIQPGDDPDDTMKDTVHRHYLEDLIRELHCTGLGWVTHYDASDPAIRAGGEEVQKIFGYRFIITEFTYPETITVDKSFNVSFSVVNDGSAPFYYDWPLELSLLDTNKNVVWKHNFTDVDIRNWLPGDGYNKATRAYNTGPDTVEINNSFVVQESLEAGKYILAISVLDPAGHVPSLRFAIENYFNGGRHPIGYVGVGTTISEFEISPDDFDDMRADRSLYYEFTAELITGEAGSDTTDLFKPELQLVNYPNPFSDMTRIEFTIGEASTVKLIVYDIHGHQIKVLVTQKLRKGKYSVDWDGSKLPGGIYLCTLNMGTRSITKKMIIMR